MCRSLDSGGSCIVKSFRPRRSFISGRLKFTVRLHKFNKDSLFLAISGFMWREILRLLYTNARLVTVLCLGWRVVRTGFRVQGSGFRVQGLGFSWFCLRPLPRPFSLLGPGIRPAPPLSCAWLVQHSDSVECPCLRPLPGSLPLLGPS